MLSSLGNYFLGYIYQLTNSCSDFSTQFRVWYSTVHLKCSILFAFAFKFPRSTLFTMMTQKKSINKTELFAYCPLSLSLSLLFLCWRWILHEARPRGGGGWEGSSGWWCGKWQRHMCTEFYVARSGGKGHCKGQVAPLRCIFLALSSAIVYAPSSKRERARWR